LALFFTVGAISDERSADKDAATGVVRPHPAQGHGVLSLAAHIHDGRARMGHEKSIYRSSVQGSRDIPCSHGGCLKIFIIDAIILDSLSKD
jgi:hypothetical protein